MEILRFITAGNVDDGKSTLIGRLLHDSKSIMEDQLEALKDASARRGHDGLNLALLTDGLRAEREQGITIDVAYRYFATPKRKYIIADCPGHFQYTRNMVTGASNANLAIVLVDATQGLTEQTRRHCFIASILKIPHVVICVNKMDLVDYSEKRFEEIRSEFKAFSKRLEIHDVTFIPISALNGDNVVEPSGRMAWYRGRSLLGHLDEVHIASDANLIDFRLPIQMVIYPPDQGRSEKGGGRDFRGYAGMIASGLVRVGDEVKALPSGFVSKVKTIHSAGNSVTEASAGESVSLELATDLDLGRGDMLVRPNNTPKVGQDIEAVICWLDHSELAVDRKYGIRHTTSDAQCLLKDVLYKFDINTLSRITDGSKISLNDFARVLIRSSRPVLFDSYATNRATGSFVLYDLATGSSVAAGMII